MTTTPDNTQDVIDSRDVIARIEELTDQRDDLTNTLEELQEAIEDLELEDTPDADALNAARADLTTAQTALEAWDAENAEELRALTDLQDEAEGSPDWSYGEALIRRSYFVDYAQELAEDCGMVEKSNQWPNYCIDWEYAARELEHDYFSVDFDGVEYLIRS